MTVENILNFIAIDAKRIADVLERKFGKPKKTTEKKTRVVSEVEMKKSTETNATIESPSISETKTDSKDISVNDLDVASEESEGKLAGRLRGKLTADDVKNAARNFVDGKSTEGKRERFEIAQSIIGKLGAKNLKTLVPEKYSEAIKLFRKAEAGWKSTQK